ncbi:hypothetical protein ACLOJK_036383, partial [Asimina triloba]
MTLLPFGICHGDRALLRQILMSPDLLPIMEVASRTTVQVLPIEDFWSDSMDAVGGVMRSRHR